MSAQEITLQNFNKTVLTMIESVQDATIEHLKANREIIKALADYCRKCPLQHTDTSNKRRLIFESTNKESLGDPVILYKYMIDRIVHAPLKIMADGAVILLMPYVDDALGKIA